MSEEKKDTIVEQEAQADVKEEQADVSINPQEKVEEKVEQSTPEAEPIKEEEKVEAPKEEKKAEFKEEIVKLEDIKEESEYPPEEIEFLTGLYNKTLSKVKEGDIISGKVLDITEKEVIVDIGFKSEGIVPLDEFDNIDDLKPGDNVEFYLETIEDIAGQLILSKRRARFRSCMGKCS